MFLNKRRINFAPVFKDLILNLKKKMNAKLKFPSKQAAIHEAKDYVMIALGMILYGIGWTVFLLPNDITTGGVPGIASIVYFATGLPVQYVYFSINFILLLLAIRILGWKFSIKTIFAVFTLTFFLSLIQQVTQGITTGDARHHTASRPAIHGLCYWRLFLWKRHRHCLFVKRKHGRYRYYCGYHQ